MLCLNATVQAIEISYNPFSIILMHSHTALLELYEFKDKKEDA